MPIFYATAVCRPAFRGCFESNVELVEVIAPSRREARRKLRETHEPECWHIKALELVRHRRPYTCCCCEGVGGHFWQSYCYSTEMYDCGDEVCVTCAGTGKTTHKRPCRYCVTKSRDKLAQAQAPLQDVAIPF